MRDIKSTRRNLHTQVAEGYEMNAHEAANIRHRISLYNGRWYECTTKKIRRTSEEEEEQSTELCDLEKIIQPLHLSFLI